MESAPLSKPLLTVVTPVYNGERHTARCLESVRTQSYPHIEHLVIDGGSSDGTARIVQAACAKSDERTSPEGSTRGLRLVSERDAGVYDAMSKGVRQARGEYVHILNSDDRYADPEALAAAVALMEAERLDICHGRARQVDADGRPVCEFGRDVDFRSLLKKMRVAHPTVVVRRSVYERHGAFSIGFRIAADHEFLLRVWNKAKVGFLPRMQVLMEIGGLSTVNGNVQRAYRESMGAAIIHGRNPLAAAARCSYEILKHRLIRSRAFAAGKPRLPAVGTELDQGLAPSGP